MSRRSTVVAITLMLTCVIFAACKKKSEELNVNESGGPVASSHLPAVPAKMATSSESATQVGEARLSDNKPVQHASAMPQHIGSAIPNPTSAMPNHYPSAPDNQMASEDSNTATAAQALPPNPESGELAWVSTPANGTCSLSHDDMLASLKFARREESDGEIAEAKNLYRKVLECDPANAEAKLGLARLQESFRPLPQ